MDSIFKKRLSEIILPTNSKVNLRIYNGKTYKTPLTKILNIYILIAPYGMSVI